MSSRKIGFAVVALAACVVGFAVYTWRMDPARRFLRNLEGNSLALPAGKGMAFLAPTIVAQVRDKAKALGIDLFRAYRQCERRPGTRLSLAYMLLLNENSDYVDYIATCPDALARDGEVLLWAYLLREEGVELTSDYRESLIAVLQQAALPEATVAVARHLIQNGRESEGVQLLLDVLVEHPAALTEEYVLGHWVFRAFAAIPSALRAEALLPYLESESLRGAYAAYVLEWNEEYAELAAGYLRRLAESDDQNVAQVARELVRMLGAWRPRDEAYPDNPDPPPEEGPSD